MCKNLKKKILKATFAPGAESWARAKAQSQSPRALNNFSRDTVPLSDL